MGLWDEGDPGLLSGRKKNKSRGGVPALEFNPPHLRRTEKRKSVLKEALEINENQRKQDISSICILLEYFAQLALEYFLGL